MSDLKNQKEIVVFNHFLDTYGGDLGKIGEADVVNTFLKNCDTLYSPTNAYFFRLCDYTYELNQRIEGFLVTGYTKDLKTNVVIPETLKGKYIIGVGYKAFLNAPMESIVVQSKWDDSNASASYAYIHPFAISNCSNLKRIDLTYATVLSMGISNCPNLEEIKNINLGSDCTLYNLPKLKRIESLFALYKRDGGGQIGFPHAVGMRKSAIYLCPNLEDISSNKGVMRRGNVVYINNNSTPVYVFDNYEIILFDEFYNNLVHDKYRVPACYNEATLEMYIPAINNGVHYKGKFYVEPDSKIYIEKEDGYYANLSYPKIVEGAEDFPEEINDPILLKIAPKISD